MMMIQAAALTNPSNKLRAAMYQLIYSVGGVADLMMMPCTFDEGQTRRRCGGVVCGDKSVRGDGRCQQKKISRFFKKDPDSFTVFNVDDG